MGLTPLEGLVMGTRSGDIDPAIIFHLHDTTGMSVDQINKMLTKESGLLGLTEVSATAAMLKITTRLKKTLNVQWTFTATVWRNTSVLTLR